MTWALLFWLIGTYTLVSLAVAILFAVWSYKSTAGRATMLSSPMVANSEPCAIFALIFVTWPVILLLAVGELLLNTNATTETQQNNTNNSREETAEGLFDCLEAVEDTLTTLEETNTENFATQNKQNERQVLIRLITQLGQQEEVFRQQIMTELRTALVSADPRSTVRHIVNTYDNPTHSNRYDDALNRLGREITNQINKLCEPETLEQQYERRLAKRTEQEGG